MRTTPTTTTTSATRLGDAGAQVMAAWTRRMLDETAPDWATGTPMPGLRAPDRLRSDTWFIPHHDMATAWRHHTEHHDDPLYGLHFAERWTLALMGPLTQLVVFAPTLGDAVTSYTAVARLIDSANLTSLSVQGDTLVLVDRPPTHEPWTRHLAESIVAGFVHVVRTSVARRLVLREVSFMHARPEHADAVEAWFGAPVHWGAADNRAVADASVLTLPMWSGSDVAFSKVRETIAGLREQLVPDDVLVDRVRRVLRRGDGDQLDVPSVDAVARTLGMSARSLQRHLGRLGLSFRRLVADVRGELLHDAPPGKRLALAQRLGFTDDSALRKFLRRSALRS